MIPSHFIPKIGEIAISFSDLDHEVIFSIWHLLGCTAAAGAVVTANINSPTTRIKILKDLGAVMLKNPDEFSRLSKLLGAIEESINQRNRLFHDMPYWFSPSTGSVGYFKHDVFAKPKPPTVVNEQWLHELLVCTRFQSNILRRFRGALEVVGQPWYEAEIPIPNAKR